MIKQKKYLVIPAYTLFLLCVWPSLEGFAQLSMVKNINTSACPSVFKECAPTCTDASSSPSSLVSGNGKVYFFAQDNSGLELWESNGTSTGTVKISQFGGNLSSPSQLVYFNERLCFTAVSPLYGEELFCFNPATKSYLVIDIYLGPGSSSPSELTVVNNLLVCAATVKQSSTVKGRELVYFNGASYFVKDLRIGTSSSNPSSLKVIDSELYFSGNGNLDGQEKGVELWTDEGTLFSLPVRRTDIYPGGGSSNPRNMTKIGSDIYFTATEPTKGTELYRWNKLADSLQVIDLYTGSNSSAPEFLTELEGKLFFSAHINTSIHPNKGRELASYNGISIGVKDIMTGVPSSNPTNLLKMGGSLYFVACSKKNGLSQGYELWHRAPNNAYTLQVKDINLGDASSLPSQLLPIGDTLFFKAYQENRWELWKTSGTVCTYAGEMNGVSPGSGLALTGPLVKMGNALYFAANNTLNGTELWKYTSPGPTSQRGFEDCYSCHEEEQEQALQVQMYPNPTSKTLHIHSTHAVLTIVLQDMQGNVRLTSTGSVMDVSQLSTGLYLVEVATIAGRVVQKVVVK